MEPQTPNLELGIASINGQATISIPGVMLDYRSLEIHLPGRERICIYVFNSLMLPIETKREGAEYYKFSGPKLGLYHDTADVREGPYINHYIEQLEVHISYPSRDEALFNIKGSCDLAKSYFNSYWYKGATSGNWTFEVSFTHWFSKA
jgi:hypothetical protein